MKKIGILALALVMALGALGVAYAEWSDTVTIIQTVETGDVKIGVRATTDYTEVENKTVVTLVQTNGEEKFMKDFEESDFPAGTLDPTSAGSYQLYDSVTIAIGNYYPSLNIREDFFIGYGGSIPVKLRVELVINDTAGIYSNMDLSWSAFFNGVLITSGSGTATAQLPLIVAAIEGQQMHSSDIVLLWIDKHLQQSAPQGVGPSTFTLTVDAVQWNEYGQ